MDRKNTLLTAASAAAFAGVLSLLKQAPHFNNGQFSLTAKDFNLIASGRLTKNLTVAESESVQLAKKYGLENENKLWSPGVDPVLQANAMIFAKYIFQPLRNWLGMPITVNNMYRGEQLNKKAGGAAGSRHRFANTADIELFIDGKQNNNFLGRAILASGIPFDRLIIEKGTIDEPNWFHIEAPYIDRKTKKLQQPRGIIYRYDGKNYTQIPRTAAEIAYF